MQVIEEKVRRELGLLREAPAAASGAEETQAVANQAVGGRR
jgi:hypothetical protein